ncbi:fibronectin type III domain-containing protein [Actinoplanes sp. NPDC051859]|uniref:fibronectin type III domain-containing protein n=1 Tax=Actinoplanes sp. NPDC051859 TaxID=3363909 RepID=UPI0037A8CC3C
MTPAQAVAAALVGVLVAALGEAPALAVQPPTEVGSVAATGNQEPGLLSVSPDGTRVYAINDEAGATDILALEGTDNSPTWRSVSVPDADPYEIAFSSDSATMYVTGNTAGNVSVIDAATGSASSSISVGNSPKGIVVTSVGSTDMAYVANAGANTVSVIDTSTASVTTTVPVSFSPIAVAASPDGKFVYVGGGSGKISKIDTSNNTVTTSATVNGGGTFEVQYLAVTPDGTTLFAANDDATGGQYSYGYIDGFTTASLAYLNTTDGNTNYEQRFNQIAVTPDGQQVYGANGGNTSGSNLYWYKVADYSSNPPVPQEGYDQPSGVDTYGVAVSPTAMKLYVTGRGLPGIFAGYGYVNTLPNSVPGVPTGVDAVPGDAQATVSFTPPLNDGGAAISTYTATSTPGGFNASCMNSPCTVSGLTNGVSYTFTVHATNSVGNSNESMPSASMAPNGPPPPTTYTDSSQPLVETVPANVCEIQFDVRGASGGDIGAGAAGKGGQVVHAVTVAPGDAYTVHVGDVGSMGSGGVSGGAPSGGIGAAGGGGASSVTMGANSSPDIIAGGGGGGGLGAGGDAGSLSGDGANGSAGGNGGGGGGASTIGGGMGGSTVEGSAGVGSAGLGGDGAQGGSGGGAGGGGGYYGGGGGGVDQFDGGGGGGGANLAPNGATTNGVRSGSGAGSVIATFTACPQATAPDAPTGLSTTPGNTTASLSFTPPVNNGGATITSYEVSTDNGVNWTTIATSAGGGGTRTATVTSLTNTTTYQIKVRAVNSVGPGTASTASSVTPATQAPGAPTGLSTSPGNASASVTFTPPVDNGGSVITSYEVSTDNGVNWTTIGTSAGGGGTRTATVSSLINTTTYQIKVRAVNGVGPGAASTASSVTPTAQAPGAPTGLSTTPGNTTATVTFTPPVDNGGSSITSYEVSTDNGVNWATITTIAAGGGTRTGTVTSLTNTTTYQVKVRAVNSVGPGAESTASSVTPGSVAPDAPTGLSTTPGNTTASLSFTPPVNNGGSAITSYEVSTDNGVNWATIATSAGGGGTRTATVSSLTNTTTYQIKVRAVNGVGPGAASTASSVTPATQVPGAPTGLSTTPGNTSASVSFTPPVDNGGSAITSYEVSTDNGVNWATIATSAGGGGTRTATVSNLTNTTTYQIKVRAVNGVGPGAASTASSVTPAAVAPGAPTGLSTQPDDTAAMVIFTPPTDNGGSAITGYEVSTNNGVNWATVQTSVHTNTQRRLSVTGLVNGQLYQVRVRAVNGVGPGTASAAATVTPAAPTPAPAAPATAPVATAGISSITVSWPAVQGAVNYKAEASPGQAFCQVDAPATSCVLGGVAGTAYTVTVVAIGPGGTSLPSAASNQVTVQEPEPPATVPTDAPLTLTTDKGKLSLAVPSQQIVVIGTGFAPFSTAKVTIYSDPIELGTVTTDANGNFSVPVTVPASLAAGAHTFLAVGVDPNGASRKMALPVTVPPTNPDTTGPGDTNKTTLPVPAGGGITLLDALNNPTTTVVIPQQGTYALDATTGAITFVPVTGFTGTATAVKYRITDSIGTIVDGTYTAVVTGGGGETPGPSPSTGSVTVKVSKLTVTRGLPAKATVPVAVSFSSAVRGRHTLVLWSTVSGKRVMLGTGRAVTTTASRSAVVTATLNPLGRAMAARLGGYPIAAAITTVPTGGGKTLRGSSRTQLVLNSFTAARPVYFATASSTISAPQRRYLGTLRSNLTGIRSITCVGHTDDRGSAAASRALGERRAREVCRTLAARTKIRTNVITKGEANPSGSNSTAAGMARNRRVDITIRY